MNILLLGKNGQIGYELCRTLLPLGQLTTLGRDEIDFLNLDNLQRVLYAHAPDVIVNAVAYTAVDLAEKHSDLAFTINSEAVKLIARYTMETQAILIHYSTDYVFDGEKSEAYLETDLPHPQNSYGASKLAGEKAIKQSGCAHLIFRTSWVFSKKNNNFVHTILKLAKEKETLSIVDDQYGAPTSAEFIADVTALAIISYYQKKLPIGTYHLTASGATNWHSYAQYIVKIALKQNATFKLTPHKIMPISSEVYQASAKRPKNSRLNHQLLAEKLGIIFPDWKIHVDLLISHIFTHTELTQS
ncbi:MAG: dTDP-4-dehydrorhamnose reductase [Legionellaceae bacterium]|nr:dTDP-4-dehydrorhamnose reductase [Legionellaceae bacterium]MBP9774353.1 dTDP-4-dehydrorhamnose reductase [Legionellaceae bacterium]